MEKIFIVLHILCTDLYLFVAWTAVTVWEVGVWECPAPHYGLNTNIDDQTRVRSLLWSPVVSYSPVTGQRCMGLISRAGGSTPYCPAGCRKRGGHSTPLLPRTTSRTDCYTPVQDPFHFKSLYLCYCYTLSCHATVHPIQFVL